MPAAPLGSQPGADRAAAGSWRQADLLAGRRARSFIRICCSRRADLGGAFLVFPGIVLIADMPGHETSPCQRPRLLSTAIIACPRAAYSPYGIPRENLIRSRSQEAYRSGWPGRTGCAATQKRTRPKPGSCRSPCKTWDWTAGLRRPRRLPCPDRGRPRPRPWPRHAADP